MEHTDCKGLGGFFFGHNYEPRFTIVEKPIKTHQPTNDELFYNNLLTMGFGATEGRKLNIVTERVYCGDVCSRCGSVINKPIES